MARDPPPLMSFSLCEPAASSCSAGSSTTPLCLRNSTKVHPPVTPVTFLASPRTLVRKIHSLVECLGNDLIRLPNLTVQLPHAQHSKSLHCLSVVADYAPRCQPPPFFMSQGVSQRPTLFLWEPRREIFDSLESWPSIPCLPERVTRKRRSRDPLPLRGG